MNLQETKEIILKWIKSCETAEQLDLASECVDRFISNRVYEESTLLDMTLCKDDLNAAILERRLLVVIPQKEIVDYPTIDRHL